MNTPKLKTLVVAFLIGFTTIISANNDNMADKKEVATTISTTVEKLLKSPDFLLNETEKATVKIIINENNEMVVLSVNTKNAAVEAFVKGRLNYKKIATKTSSEVFTLPIKVLASK